MRQRLWTLCVMLAFGMCIAQVAQGQLITNLERTNSENGEPQLVPEGLEVGASVFVDRTHEYLVLPEFLLGLDYAMLANNDKVNADFQLHVTLARGATLYLFLDNRIGDNDGDNPPALGPSVMPWVMDMGFTTTYEQVGVDEKGTGVVNRWYTIYMLDVPAGTTTLFAQNDGGSRSMYNIAVWAPSLTAAEPRPEDGAVDVPLDATLAWTPGADAATQDVYFGAVFDDVSNASRANPMNVLLSKNQDANTFDPMGLLQLDGTYFWRIDGIAADGTVTKGNVWQFAVEAAGAPIAGDLILATASSSEADSGPENTINGSGLNDRDEHSTAVKDMWQSEGGAAEPAWIQYAFDRVYKLHELWVWNYNGDLEFLVGFGIKDVTVEYSMDGASWTVLGEFEFAQGTSSPDYTPNTTVDFGGVLAQYVRLVVNSSFKTSGRHGLSEVRFLAIPTYARQPDPGVGETDVDTEAVLTWRAGRDAALHEVYLSAAESAVVEGTESIDTVAENRYDVSGLNLDLSRTYYWKVNEVNDAEPIVAWAGDVWSFTTQDSYLVDDFESYNDNYEAGTAIWQTWRDGLDVDETNGSQVGHNPGPYAERGTVRVGRQSMPFHYRNEGMAVYSEAERTFEVAQDWTRGAAQSLVLFFHGVAENTAGRLYVKINDATVVYDGSMSDLSKAFWIQWVIDLTAVETDLTAVRTLILGVDNGGAGTLFFDDIRLYREAPEAAQEEVWIEAEAADTLVSPMRIYSDRADASGGQYIATFGDSSSGTPPDDGGVAHYTVRLTGGTYRIIGRVIAPTGDDDSFWVRFQGATTNTLNHESGWIRWGLETGANWHEVPVQSMDDENATVLFTAEPGLYNLEIAYREDGALLDAWIITQQLE